MLISGLNTNFRSTLLRSVALLTVLVIVNPLWGAGSDMDSEIDFLLDSVVESDCVFIRNGSKHKAQAARDHLQMKRKRGSRYFSDTEEFINRIASQSSWSGKVYLIQCGEEPQQTAKAWFTQLLQQYRSRS